MKFFGKSKNKINEILQIFDPNSLGMRLTVGIALLSAFGLGGVAIWISLRMQHLLVATNKQTIQYIGERIPRDIEIYHQMVEYPVGVQKAIDNLTDNETKLWVEDTTGNIIAKSVNVDARILSLNNIPIIPEVSQVDGRYWLMCSDTLKVNGEPIGTIYIAQDLTGEQVTFLHLIRSISISTALSIGLMTIAIAIYVKRSLEPLQRISKLTENISMDDLGEAKLQLENSPSEVKELTETFSQMLTRLGETWEHQRQLVSNVSHELRTPLTIVSGYLQSTLRRGDNLTSAQREALQIAHSEADRTIQLMQDLLDLARADSGRMHFNEDKINLSDLTEEVVAMARQYSQREINLESEDYPIHIKADNNRLKQVLLNLIDNAVKYSAFDTSVMVKIYRYEERAVIQVCDSGIGIPLSQQARIFERFFRADEARSRNSAGGTGLGLSIVKTLVEGMGGAISVRSQLNKGSIFTVTFPAIEKKEKKRPLVLMKNANV